MSLNPSNNKNLYGYNSFFLELKNLYDKNLLPNKIIFSGNEGIGKTTLAYHLTNYIFSCNENNKYNFKENKIIENNNSYNLIVKNSHPNFFLISSDEDKNNIQISKIREMINFTNKSSFNNEAKIILIDNIEFLNLNAVNALLKIIEEPNDNLFFFLTHNSKTKILDTLNSRCIKFKLFLDENSKSEIYSNILDKNFLNSLNNDFKNIYNTPGQMVLLNDFFIRNEIDSNISINDLLKIIIAKKIFKKDLFVKNNIKFFIELFFDKNIFYSKSKTNIYTFYKYFLSKLYDCDKYNLDVENVLIEFNGKVLNG